MSRGSALAGASYQALAEEIALLFAVKLAGLRRQLRPWEIPAAIAALRHEQEAALRALRERLATERHAERQELRRLRGPPCTHL